MYWLPEVWSIHFGNVADVNEWDDEQKLKWLKVRLTGRAQKAFQRLPEASRATFNLAKAALKVRFEPESSKTRYQAEFQSRRKKTSEGWADFADDLQSLAEKAYPSLQHEARERLAINAYLQQLTQPQVAFSVKQRNPETLDDAVAATLEMEPCWGSFHATARDRGRYCCCSTLPSNARGVSRASGNTTASTSSARGLTW